MREYRPNQPRSRFCLNSFRLNGMDRLNAGYRLIRYSGVLDEEDEDYEKKVRLLSNILSRDLHLPVEPVQLNDGRVLAVMGSREQLAEIRVPAEVPLTPDVALLRLETGLTSLSFQNRGYLQSKLARRALLWAVEGALSAQTSEWWRYQRRFVSRAQLQESAEKHVLVYPAFYFSVVPGQDGWLELFIDPSVCSVERQSLYEKHGDTVPSSIKGKRYLYTNGLDWYPIAAAAISNPASREMMTDPITGLSISIYQRLKDRWSGKGIAAIENLSPNAPTVAYKTLSEQSRRAHSELLFELLGVEGSDNGEDSPHSESIMPPAIRGTRTEWLVSAIESYLGIFGRKLQPARAMRRLLPQESEIFEPPALRFAGDQELETNLETAGRDRIAALRGIGPAESSPFADQQFLVRPASMPEGVWKDFSSRFVLQVQDLCGHSPSPIGLKFDKVYGLRPQARALEKVIGDHHGCGLVVLPVMADRERQTMMHHHLKRKYWEQFHTQCADQEMILSFYRRSAANGHEQWFVRNEQQGVYRSYLRNLVFGYLMANRKWLWKLAHGSLRSQVHVGIDVFKGMAVFTFIYGDAELITFKPSKARRAEKLSGEQVYEVLIENLGPDLAQLDMRARSITFHRDGRLYETELRGIRRALNELRDNYKLLTPDFKLGIVEVHKTSSTRPRVYRDLRDGFENPDMGFFARLNDREGVVATTGFPMLKKGTAHPLYFERVAGEIDIADIGHDIYALSHLAFSAPGSCHRLPFSIGLADYILRERTPGDDKPLWDEEEEKDAEIAYKSQKGGVA